MASSICFIALLVDVALDGVSASKPARRVGAVDQPYRGDSKDAGQIRDMIAAMPTSAKHVSQMLRAHANAPGKDALPNPHMRDGKAQPFGQ